MTSAVAIINWNSGNWLRACIESLLATATNAEILVIDNASVDTSLESVEGFRNRVNFVRNSVNRGFAAAINQAFELTSTSYVLVLNPDIRVMPGAVLILEGFMSAHPQAGAVGGYVNEKYLPREFPTVAALVRENLGFSRGSTVAAVYDRRKTGAHRPPLQLSEAFPVEQPAAAALMIRRDAWESVGGFDEQFYPAWYEDVDFCRRIKAAGWEIYFAPKAEFLHEGGYSVRAMGSEDFARAYYSNQMRYARKHFGSMGRAAVRASIAAGMIGRMIGRPKQAAAYAKTLIGALKGW
jgi:GT2 family glycosyltransferase